MEADVDSYKSIALQPSLLAPLRYRRFDKGWRETLYSQANKSNVKKLSKITAGEPHASQHIIL